MKAVRENAHFGARVIKLVADDQPYTYSTEDLAPWSGRRRGRASRWPPTA